MTQRTQLRGIVAVGTSLAEAQEFYRAVATGKDVKAYQDDGDNFVVLSSASSPIELLNPMTGSEDMRVSDGLADQMEFLASSGEKVDVNYTVCTAGCHSHILADDPEMMKYCPACASELKDLSEDEIEALSRSEDEEGCDDCEIRQSAIASGATLEEAVAAFRAAITGEAETVSVKGKDVITAVAGAHNFDVYTGSAATVVEQEQDDVLESLASSGDEIEAHHFVCSSSACEAPHVVSLDDMPVFCPSCSSGLLDPEEMEAEASSEEDDYEEDDRLSAYASDEDEDDEDDEDEEDDSDLDDEDEEEDDLDEDEDEEDDEEEDEEDDEDEDGIVSLSRVVRARNRSQEAVASAASEEVETVQASFVSIAGADDTSKLSASYAQNVGGEAAWIAFYDGIPFAKATASSSNDNKMFNDAVFGRAFLAQASENGVTCAMENMGFEEIRPQINIGKYINTEVERLACERVKEAQAVFDRDKAELADRFMSAMNSAATGLANGFFRGERNPIADALANILTDIGIENARNLVASAFAKHSDEYNRTVLNKANRILGYNLETQNEISEAIAATANSVESETSARMAVGRPVRVEKEAPIEATASTKPSEDVMARMQRAVSSLGKR